MDLKVFLFYVFSSVFLPPLTTFTSLASLKKHRRRRISSHLIKETIRISKLIPFRTNLEWFKSNPLSWKVSWKYFDKFKSKPHLVKMQKYVKNYVNCIHKIPGISFRILSSFNWRKPPPPPPFFFCFPHEFTIWCCIRYNVQIRTLKVSNSMSVFVCFPIGILVLISKHRGGLKKKKVTCTPFYENKEDKIVA